MTVVSPAKSHLRLAEAASAMALRAAAPLT